MCVCVYVCVCVCVCVCLCVYICVCVYVQYNIKDFPKEMLRKIFDNILNIYMC